MEAVRIREGVETEEEVLTGAAIVGRQAGRVRVQLKTDVETVEETEEKPKHYRFTLIAPVKLQSWKPVLTEAWLNGLRKPGELQQRKRERRQQKRSTTISKRQPTDW